MKLKAPAGSIVVVSGEQATRLLAQGFKAVEEKKPAKDSKQKKVKAK